MIRRATIGPSSGRASERRVARQRAQRFKRPGGHGAADLPRRIIGRPDDFLKIAPGPILGPWGGQNRIPREKYSDFTGFHNYSPDFLKICPGVLFWGPRAVKIGFLAKFHADFTYFHNCSTGDFENHDF